MENSKARFILASASPRRKELVGHLNIPFEIMTLNVPEESKATDPVDYSLSIAKLKGEAVFRKLVSEDQTNDLFVVSADTIVCLDGKIYGKPVDEADARRILSELSGRTHSVFTAVVIQTRIQGKFQEFSFVDESRVTFNTISPSLMENYLQTKDSLDKAGAYGIQGPSLTFISKVDGDYANVVGFPLSRFVQETEKFFKPLSSTEESWLQFFQR